MGEMKKKEGKPLAINNDWLKTVANSQMKGIEQAEDTLVTIIQVGMRAAEYEYQDSLCYETELLIDHYMPGILREFRHFFYMLYYLDDSTKQEELIDILSSLISVVVEAKKVLPFRAAGMEPDVDSVIESKIGYLWKSEHLLKYGLYEDNAEIIQLSFNSLFDKDRRVFKEHAYWFNLKTGKIHYTLRIRPYKGAKHIKPDNTVFEVLQIDKLFTYPGQMNNRIRWQTNPQHKSPILENYATILQYAENNYNDIILQIKKSFINPLADKKPVFLVKLHKTFVNGDNLVLEDEQGGCLTVLSEVGVPSTELLRAILPTQPLNSALLVQLNDDVETGLFSVTPLSLVTSEKIIRLLY